MVARRRRNRRRGIVDEGSSPKKRHRKDRRQRNVVEGKRHRKERRWRNVVVGMSSWEFRRGNFRRRGVNERATTTGTGSGLAEMKLERKRSWASKLCYVFETVLRLRRGGVLVSRRFPIPLFLDTTLTFLSLSAQRLRPAFSQRSTNHDVGKGKADSSMANRGPTRLSNG